MWHIQNLFQPPAIKLLGISVANIKLSNESIP